MKNLKKLLHWQSVKKRYKKKARQGEEWGFKHFVRVPTFIFLQKPEENK